MVAAAPKEKEVMATVWLLMWLSSGYYNKGTLTVVEFPTEAACRSAGIRLEGISTGGFVCIERTM